MKLIELGRFARARLWTEELPNTKCMGDVSCRVVGGGHSSVSSWSACVEVFIPRGAMAEYALLGGSFQPNGSGQLVLEVISGKRADMGEFESLASEVDAVHVGLPREYLAAVLNAWVDVSDLPSGVVRIDHAAHGLAGSSSNLFGLLAGVLVSTLCGDAHSCLDLEERLRSTIHVAARVPPA